MKKLMLIILLVLLIGRVRAEVERKELQLQSNCVEEDVLVKIRGNGNINKTYSIINCSKWKNDKWEFWKCNCYGQDKLFIDIDINSSIKYDIMVQYYIERLEEVTDKEKGQINPSPIELRNEDRKRSQVFNNVQVTPIVKNKEKEKDEFNLSDINMNFISILIGSVLIGIIIFGFFGVLWIRKQFEDHNEIKKKKNEPPPGFKKLNESDVDKYVDKYM